MSDEDRRTLLHNTFSRLSAASQRQQPMRRFAHPPIDGGCGKPIRMPDWSAWSPQRNSPTPSTAPLNAVRLMPPETGIIPSTAPTKPARMVSPETETPGTPRSQRGGATFGVRASPDIRDRQRLRRPLSDVPRARGQASWLFARNRENNQLTAASRAVGDAPRCGRATTFSHQMNVCSI